MSNGLKAVFTIMIEGEEIQNSIGVKNITINKEIFKTPYAVIDFADGGWSAQDPASLADEPTFAIGNTITIKASNHHEEAYVDIFEGIIVKASMKARRGTTTFSIEAKDITTKMTMGRSFINFQEIADQDTLGNIINQRYSGDITFEVDGEIALEDENLNLYQISDWDAIALIAERNGAVMKVENGNIILKEITEEKEPQKTIRFDQKELINFQIKTDITKYNAKVMVNAISEDYSSVETTEEMINLDEGIGGINGNVKWDDFSGVESLQQINAPAAQQKVDTFAKALRVKKELAICQGYLELKDFTEITQGDYLEILGLNTTFDGVYFISGVEYIAEGGTWTTKATIGIDERTYVDLYEMKEAAASNMLPKVGGMMMGIVKELVTDEKGYRFKVRIPTIHTEDEFVWATIATLYATETGGIFFMPEVNDNVLLGFINEDFQNAVIVGAMYNQYPYKNYKDEASDYTNEAGAEVTLDDENKIKAITTKKGLEISFDDENDIINIATPQGKKITLGKEDDIKIYDQNENVILMKEDVISIFANAKVNIEGKDEINLKSKKLTIEADEIATNKVSKINLEASSSTIVKSKSKLEVGGNSMTTVSGGQIHIG